MRRVDAIVAGIATTVGAWLLTWRSTGDPDAWWHLAAGRMAAATQTWLPTDPFSYSFGGTAWVAKDIVADLLLWRVFEVDGFVSVALFLAVGFALAAWPWRHHLRPVDPAAPDYRSAIFVAALLVYFAAISMSATLRPRVFSLMLLGALLGCLERVRLDAQPDGVAAVAGRRKRWGHVVTLGGVAGLAFVLHRGALAAAPLLLGLPLYLAVARFAGRWPRLATLFGPAPTWGAVALSGVPLCMLVGAVFVHPSGWAAVTSTFGVIGSDIYRANVSEFQPISLGDAWEHFRVTMVVASLSAIAAAYASVRALAGDTRWQGLAWPLAVAVVYASQAPSSVRWLSYVSGACVALLLWIAGRWVASLSSRHAESAPSPRLMTVLAAVSGLSLIAGVHTHELGPGEAPNRFPSGALAWAREHGLGSRVHNAFVFGGYLAWAEDGAFKPLIDGRNDMIYPAEFFLRCVEAQRDPAAFSALAREFPSDFVLASNPGPQPAFGFLDQDPDWVPVYWSEPATIYLRRGTRPDLEAQAFRFLKPFHPSESIAAAVRWAGSDRSRLAAIEAELLRMQAASPDGVQPLSLLVVFYHGLGPDAAPRRDAAWGRLLAVAPEHPAVLQLARALALPKAP
jgi:hypothetical protein